MGDKPLIVAPAVSVIVSELRKRPYWQQDKPLAVPSDLWEAAREEMAALMKKRGFRLPVSYAVENKVGVWKSVKAENFLIQGTVIVTGAERQL